MHWKGIAHRPHEKAFDLLLMCVGLVAMVYSTVMVINQWVQA